MSHPKPNNNKIHVVNYEQQNNLREKASVKGAEVPSTLGGLIQSPDGRPL
jgi:hypothetical protein